jgi:hypothetical protein
VVPPPFERGATCQGGSNRLASTPSLGVARLADSSQGGLGHLNRRVGLWLRTAAARAALGRRGAAAAGFLSATQLWTALRLPPSPPDDTAGVSQQLRAAEFVYIKAPPAALSLSPAFRGPYAVHKRSEKFYIVKIGQWYEAVS